MEFSHQRLDTVIVGAFAFSLLVLYFLLCKTRAKRLPPQAGGSWPLIGHLHLLGGSKLPHIILGELADKYGPVFTIRLGIHRALVVSSWEVAKDLFTIYDQSISSRPELRASKHLGYDGAMFAFSPYGPYWREIRKITSLELFSSRRLQFFGHIRVSETKTSVKELYNQWKEKKNSSDLALVEMKQWFRDLTFNVILRIVAGKRFYGGAAASSDEGAAAARRFEKAIRDFFYFLGMNVLADALPFLGWLDWGGHEKKMKRTAKEMDEIISGWLEEHRQRWHSDMAMRHNDLDIMDVLLSATDGAQVDGYDASTVAKATCVALISGGTDTSTVMLTWALSLLMNNPNVLTKAQEELDIHVGKERHVNESDIVNLIYLQAIVKETLRLYPGTPLSAPREFTEDCNLRGYHAAKGTRLILNVWKLQRDPNVWSEPTEFKPERFLTTHENVDVKGQHFELLPFGAGRRICPGANFALHMIHLVLANLLHGFDLSIPSNALVDMTESFGLTNMKATPLEVLITPRLTSSVY
uniref:Cytochrome P450 n=1 Tax=Nothapodytes nimmoniana TaxID=159386 RepID=A0A7L7RB44_NOTNI|nr:cytochrome P450 [Nothapodytes nimmoniana]